MIRALKEALVRVVSRTDEFNASHDTHTVNVLRAFLGDRVRVRVKRCHDALSQNAGQDADGASVSTIRAVGGQRNQSTSVGTVRFAQEIIASY